MAVQEQVYGFFIPSVTLIGIGAAKQIPDKIKALGGSKPLLVTDKGVVAVGICKQVTDLLDAANMPYVVYDETVPNPTTGNVHAALAIYRKEGCDSLIGLGGGSSMDTAKACGVLATSGGDDILAYAGPGTLKAPLPCYIAIPTTAGTGSESTCIAVITNDKGAHHVKFGVADPRLLPKVAIIDPLLMTGLPPFITAATGMDALTHAVEAYISLGASEYTDALAIGAVKLIFKYLRRAVGNGNDIEAREKMAYAQTMAGMAFSNGGLGIVHSLAHPLSAFYGIPHGDANALVLPYVLEFNKIVCREKLADVARAAGLTELGPYPEDTAVEAIKRLSADVRIAASITEAASRRGVTVDRADIPALAKDAMGDPCTPTNPRVPTVVDIEGLYTRCW